MDRRIPKTAVAVAMVALSLSLLAWAGTDHHQPKGTLTLEQVHSKILPMSLKTIEAIREATHSGDRQTAIKELTHLQAMLRQVQAVVAKQVGPRFANAKCPIMGHPIDPQRVPDHLVREYKGQKVAFCCPGCPEKWDGLSEAQKEAKLEAKRTPVFINTTCPIMGSPVNLAKVPSNLVRDYEGQKVAFCCPGCPAQWDKLSDSQKRAKLAKVEVDQGKQAH